MSDEPVCCYTASAARIDVCFHIEWSMELVSRGPGPGRRAEATLQPPLPAVSPEALGWGAPFLYGLARD